MEYHVVIGPRFGQRHQLRHSFGRKIGGQINHNLALGDTVDRNHQIGPRPITLGQSRIGQQNQRRSAQKITQHQPPPVL